MRCWMRVQFHRIHSPSGLQNRNCGLNAAYLLNARYRELTQHLIVGPSESVCVRIEMYRNRRYSGPERGTRSQPGRFPRREHQRLFLSSEMKCREDILHSIHVVTSIEREEILAKFPA